MQLRADAVASAPAAPRGDLRPRSVSDLLRDSLQALPGARRAEKSPAPFGRRSTAFWLGLVLCYQIVTHMFMGKTLSRIAAEEAEEELCDARGLGATSANCAEHNMFKNWQANAAADELLDVEHLLRASRPLERETSTEKPSEAASQGSVLDGVEDPSGSGNRSPMMDEVAHAICEMCMEPHHRDSDKCSQFRGVTSCGEAREGGVLTEWATSVEKLQEDLRLKVEASREHHRRLEEKHPLETFEGEPHPLLKDIALAMCKMCKEPRHRDSEKCARYRDVSSCGAAAHEAAASGRLFAPAPTPSAPADDKLKEKVDTLGCELCADPVRRGRASCKLFVDNAACQEHLKAAPSTSEENNGQEAKRQSWERIDSLMRDICKDPSRKSLWACQKLLEPHAYHPPHFVVVGEATSAPPTEDPDQDPHRRYCKDPTHHHLAACKLILHEAWEPVPHHAAEHRHDAARRVPGRGTQAHAMQPEGAKLHAGNTSDVAKHFEGNAQHARDPQAEPRDPGLAEHFREWEAGAADRALEIGQELCADPARRPYAACRELLQAQPLTSAALTSTVAGSPSGTRGWPMSPSAGSLRGSSTPPPLMFPEGGWSSLSGGTWNIPLPSLFGDRNGVAVVTPRQLRREEAAEWQGRIPKVVCVALVPDGPTALEQLQVTVESFRAQSYEGLRELRLVHHSGHRDTAQLVRAVADGELVKGLAVYGEDPFPSTTPYRFGAWKADADLVARWEFGAWHHPHRLAAQIRAMAVVARPAVLLGGGGRPDGSHVGGQEQTLIGDAAWMRKHWYPLLQRGSQLLDGPRAKEMARLDMPELYIPAP